MKAFSSLFVLALAGCVSSPAVDALYFPELAARARDHEAAALEQVLKLSATTAPGEHLEELAELAASYVRPAPTVFLRAQLSRPGCFGVGFLGPKFVDNSEARALEREARRRALASVTDAALSAVQARCSAKLAGS